MDCLLVWITDISRDQARKRSAWSEYYTLNLFKPGLLYWKDTSTKM